MSAVPENAAPASQARPERTLAVARSLASRIRLARAIAAGAVGFLAGAAAGAVLLLASTRFPAWHPLAPWAGGIVTLVGLVGGFAAGWRRPVSLAQGAGRADAELGLHDRLTSAVELAGIGEIDDASDARAHAGPFAGVLYREAESAAGRVQPAKIVPIPFARDWLYGLAALAVGVAGWALLPVPELEPPTPLAAASPESIREADEALAETIESLDARTNRTGEDNPEEGVANGGVADRLESIRDRLERGEVRPEDALAEAASELERAASETDRASADPASDAIADAARAAEDDLSEASEDLADALSAGDLGRARDAARELLERTDGMPPEARERIARDLERLADALDESANELGKSDGAGRGEERTADDELTEALRERTGDLTDEDRVAEALEGEGVDAESARELAERIAREERARRRDASAREDVERLRDALDEAARDLDSDQADPPADREPARDAGDDANTPADRKSPERSPEGADPETPSDSPSDPPADAPPASPRDPTDSSPERERGEGSEGGREQPAERGERRSGEEGSGEPGQQKQQQQQQSGDERRQSQQQEGRQQEDRQQGDQRENDEQSGEGRQEGQAERPQEGEGDRQRPKDQPSQQQSDQPSDQDSEEQADQPSEQPSDRPANQQSPSEDGRRGEQRDQSTGESREQSPDQQSGEQSDEPGNQPGEGEGGDPGAQSRPGGENGEQATPRDTPGSPGSTGEGAEGDQQRQAPRPAGDSEQGGDGMGEGTRGVDRLTRELDRLSESQRERRSRREVSDDMRKRAQELLDKASPEEREKLAERADELAERFAEREASPARRPYDPGSESVDARDPTDTGRDGREQTLDEWYNPEGEVPEGVDRSARTPEALREAADSADHAVEQQRVPPRYRRLVREVFKNIRERAAKESSGGGAALGEDADRGGTGDGDGD